MGPPPRKFFEEVDAISCILAHFNRFLDSLLLHKVVGCDLMAYALKNN